MLKRKISKYINVLLSFLLACSLLSGCNNIDFLSSCLGMNESVVTTVPFDLDSIPQYTNSPYCVVNNNIPYFNDEELTTSPFERYSKLDSLGRCGTAYANVCQEIMPTKKRGSIEEVKPSGWHSVKYDNVDGKSLYNRCHLIGYQLSGENANKENLITGTRYLNTQGMLPFENIVADYVKETDNHVLYRVTPVFEGDNLVATGVLMEGLSVEDKGDGVCFNVFCYNVQPDITIDYATGESSLNNANNTDNNEKSTKKQKVKQSNSSDGYVGNKNAKKFHKSSCKGVKQIKDSNKVLFSNRDEAIEQGYKPCQSCNP